FERIYAGTMVRLDSKPWYRFDHSFFTALHRSCPDRLVYVAAEQDGRPVSMDLLLLGRDTAYYLLGDTDIEAARSRPNALLKMDGTARPVARSYRRYVLGGGARPGVGLERCKKGYAPPGGTSFRAADRVLAPAGYAALVQARRTEALDPDQDWGEDSDFFPLYRAPMRPRDRERVPEMSGGSS